MLVLALAAAHAAYAQATVDTMSSAPASAASTPPSTTQTAATAPSVAVAPAPAQAPTGDPDPDAPVAIDPNAPPPMIQQAPKRAGPIDPWADEIRPLSFTFGFSGRVDREHRFQTGVAVGVEYRVVRRLSVQALADLGVRPHETDNDDVTDDRRHNDYWMTATAGLKWAPIAFKMIGEHPADIYVTGGVLESTSSRGAFRTGTYGTVGGGLSYFFEPNVSGILDWRGVPGHRSQSVETAAINFQFP